MKFLSNEVASVNERVDNNIFSGAASEESVPLPKILVALSKFSAEVVEMVMGKRGKGLISFQKEVDLQHPDLPELLPDNEVAALICDSLELGEFALGKKLSSAPGVSKYIAKQAKTYLRGVDNPHHFVRLFKDEARRTAERQNKHMRQLDMHKNYMGGPAHGFKMFVRHSDSYKEEYDNACRIMARYKKLGCDVLEKTIKKTIDGFEKAFDDSHLGFHRISLTNAAVILANIHGCTSYKDEVIFPKALVSAGSVQKRYKGNYCYSPRVYPYHELKQLSSPRIEKIINHLEHLPEKNGKPVFDHFLVVVPGMKLTGEYGRRQNPVASDAEMIAENLIYPILVGERDGKCYFISYWTYS